MYISAKDNRPMPKLISIFTEFKERVLNIYNVVKADIRIYNII